jgi:adenosine deaminase
LTLARYPKVELHIHLEGCLTPADAVALARRNGLKWAPDRLLSLYRHGSFKEFLVHFGALLDLFKSPEDLCWLLDRTLSRLRRQGVIYCEMRLSPSVWERHGLHAERSLSAILRYAAARAAPVRFIVDAVRQWEQGLLMRDLDLACAYRDQGVVALGIGGDEAAVPAGDLVALADECKARSIPVIPHAGEVLGPHEVASAVEVFRARRIGHGISAARSPALMGDLARRGVHLEVCPTSNRRTGAVPRGSRHPLRRLWQAGVQLSLGTDDPALFGATLCGELSWAERSAGWTRADTVLSQALAARASLLPKAARDDLARRISAGWEP